MTVWVEFSGLISTAKYSPVYTGMLWVQARYTLYNLVSRYRRVVRTIYVYAVLSPVVGTLLMSRRICSRGGDWVLVHGMCGSIGDQLSLSGRDRCLATLGQAPICSMKEVEIVVRLKCFHASFVTRVFWIYTVDFVQADMLRDCFIGYRLCNLPAYQLVTIRSRSCTTRRLRAGWHWMLSALWKSQITHIPRLWSLEYKKYARQHHAQFYH